MQRNGGLVTSCNGIDGELGTGVDIAAHEDVGFSGLVRLGIGDGTLAVSFESASWGTFSVASAAVTASEGGYAITGSGSVAMGMGGASSSYDFTMNGVINASKESFSIAFDVPAVMGGLTVTLLSGQAPAADQQ